MIENLPSMYYVDTEIEPHEQSLGAEFEVVYSPQNPPMTERQQGWYIVTFEVVTWQDIRPPFDWHRMYQDNGWRRISEEEALTLWQE